MGNSSEDKREILVDVINLTKSFGSLLVLDNVSFQVRKGEFLCIVGPTGCGKTTFLNSLVSIFDITAGQINLNGEKVDLRKHNISYVLQEASTMQWLTVEENIRFGLEIKKVPREDADKQVDEVLKLVKLEECRSYYPNQLSISMLQRVVIARAFVTKPQLLLMDEPYGQLDLSLRYRLEDELLELWRRMGTTVIFITHNIEEACYLGERVLILTNKPATIKEELKVGLPHPRSISDPEFVKLRNHVTEQIKWW